MDHLKVLQYRIACKPARRGNDGNDQGVFGLGPGENRRKFVADDELRSQVVGRGQYDRHFTPLQGRLDLFLPLLPYLDPGIVPQIDVLRSKVNLQAFEEVFVFAGIADEDTGSRGSALELVPVAGRVHERVCYRDPKPLEEGLG